jgi:RNA polymerase sigma factor (sigma-70 family)
MRFALARELDLRTLSDDRLAQMAADRDLQAFAAIYERHHQGLYRYCLSIVGQREDARDALQSTMLQAFDGIGSYSRGGALRAWLYRIAHNESISLLRRKRPNEEITEQELPTVPSAARQASDRARLGQLLADLRRLPERQRSALVMRELNGLEHAEIGAALGTSPAAAKQAVYEARKALSEHAEGRDTACETIRMSISGRDGRVARGRRIQAHLRDCVACRDFDATVAGRAAGFAALAPPLPAVLGAATLDSALRSGGAARRRAPRERPERA